MNYSDYIRDIRKLKQSLFAEFYCVTKLITDFSQPDILTSQIDKFAKKK